MCLTVGLLPGLASPLSARIGSAQVDLTLDPDPPTPGLVHAKIHVTGVAGSVLAGTTVRFQTDMPSMSMAGPSGAARVGKAPDDFDFDVVLGTATTWSITARFSGAFQGSATYGFTVGQKTKGIDTSAPSATAATDMKGMAGMAPAGGNPDAWRNAFFGLIVLMLVGIFVLRRDRRPIVLGMFMGAGLLVLVFAVLQYRYTSPGMDQATMQGAGPIPVTLSTVRGGEGSTSVFAPGTVQPYLTQDILARAPGILRGFAAYNGDHIRAGEVLATLDAPELGSQAQAAYADAQAQVANARAAGIESQRRAPAALSISQNDAASTRTDLAAAIADQRAKAQQNSYWHNEIRREESLYSAGAVSQQELQDERAQAAAARSADQGALARIASMQQQLAAANSRIANARANIDVAQQQSQAAQAQASRAGSAAQAAGTMAAYRTVVSPDDAVVLKRLVDPGVYVQVGTPILRIAVVNRLRIQANVAQQDLAQITIGTPIEARLSNGKTLHGRVSSISPAADPATHTAQVEAIVSGNSSGISAGGYVRVRLLARGVPTAGALQIPSSAIVGGGADAAVWLDKAGVAQRVHVQILSDDGTTAFVKSSLSRGARIVVDGAATLEEGQAIIEQPA